MSVPSPDAFLAMVEFAMAVRKATDTVKNCGVDKATAAAVLQVASQVLYAQLSDNDKRDVVTITGKFTEEIIRQTPKVSG